MKRDSEEFGGPSDADDRRAARRSRWDEGADNGSEGPAGSPATAGSMLLKVLVSIDEAASLRGPEVLHNLGRRTKTELMLSAENQLYPGTSLHELRCRGPTSESVVAGIMDAFGRIVDVRGVLCCGDTCFEPGAARTRVVIPARATAAVIGPAGKIVGQIRMETKMHVHIETVVVPPGVLSEVTEQVVSVDGPLPGVQPALMLLSRILSQFIGEVWYTKWTFHTNAGVHIPGFVLFQDGKGRGVKSRGKGKDRGGLTMKLLMPPNETSCVLGKGGQTVREVGQATGTRLATSGRFEFFPGTHLQELKIQGSTQDSVLNAVAQILSKVAESAGSVSGGIANVEPGGARIKVVVPVRATPAIVGPDGAMLRILKERSGMTVHVEDAIIPAGAPAGDLSEQVVCMSGPLEGSYAVLKCIAEAVGQFAGEAWFELWASHSNCTAAPQDFTLFGEVKGRGRGRGMGPGKGRELLPEESSRLAPAPSVLANAASSEPEAREEAPAGRLLDGPLAASCAAVRAESSPPPPAAAPERPPPPCGPMALKVLMSPDEVGILAEDPTCMLQIQKATSTLGILSEQPYPGTGLLELGVQGPSVESVFNAVLLIITRLAEVLGCVNSGEPDVAAGEARVKLVVPARVAASLVGPGGQTVKQIKAQTGISVIVDGNYIPCIDKVLEQAICLAGPLPGIQPSLGQVVTEVAYFLNEPWFQGWADHSNAGVVIPGIALFSAKGRS